MLGRGRGVQKVSQKDMSFPSGPIGDSDRSGSRHAVRSERTRTALLTAAATIFARDGFEASRIEDIAAEAGRSRGAFYANFENKTEVFLALRSLAIRLRAHEIRERIEHSAGEAERIVSVNRYLLEQICDTKTLLLQIEFKLFALRHPEMRAELAVKHLEASTSINLAELSDLFPEKKSQTLSEHRRHTLAIEALLEGFALNALFSPEVLDLNYLQKVLPQLLAYILLQKG
jgi:AcrR family transcriptional regulator